MRGCHWMSHFRIGIMFSSPLISQTLRARSFPYLTCSVSWDFSFSSVANSISWFRPFSLTFRLNKHPCRLWKFISSIINWNLILYSDSIISLKSCSSPFIVDTEVIHFKLNATEKYLWSLSSSNSNIKIREYKVQGKK